ncbi:hypothetical protein F5Y13DRAFT_206776 [Hypoxylon sp. FL1857]|nr:hypothetical protein F5Y13DRAFT_206776 [Hypoxylon sp. FL1857]
MELYPQMDPAYAAAESDGGLRETQTQEDPLRSSHQVDPTRIPLVCYSCEKQQTFSDLSHLLTHVSSKAHLLELYNLQILSQVDRAAAIRCQRFETWSKTYNISQLVLQRMEARGEKGAQQQRRSQTPRDSTSGRPATRRSSRGGRGGRGRRGNANTRGRSRRVDEIKYESDEGMGFTDGGYDGFESPSIQSWQSLNALIPHGGGLDILPQGADNLEDKTYSPKYASSEGGSSYPSENISESTEMNEMDSGPLGLKGIFFPGMGLFDAAGEEQRRKRNQRKPPAVLHQLELNSTLVTTEEVVLDSNLDHQRTRDVYDDPSTAGSEVSGNDTRLTWQNELTGIQDEDEEDDTDKKRKRRVSKARAALTTRKTRHNAVSHATRSTRVTRATAQAAQRLVPTEDVVPSARSRALESGGRLTRSAVNRGTVSQAAMPLHGHGFHGDVDLYHDQMVMDTELGWNLSQVLAGSSPANTEQQTLPAVPLEDEDGSESWLMPEFSDMMYHGLTFHDRQDRLPALALRPGNPNLSFASPTPSLKRSPSHFLGKENDSLTMKSATASSNPYLQSTNPSHGDSYNPLYVQPREGFGFQMYPSYDEDVKTETTSFQSINGQSGLNSLHMASHPNAMFPTNQGGNDFDL